MTPSARAASTSPDAPLAVRRSWIFVFSIRTTLAVRVSLARMAWGSVSFSASSRAMDPPSASQPARARGGRGRLAIRPRLSADQALAVDPGRRHSVAAGRRHVVEVALRGVQPARVAQALARGHEVAGGRLLRTPP